MKSTGMDRSWGPTLAACHRMRRWWPFGHDGIFPLSRIQSGVLALRVWKAPLSSASTQLKTGGFAEAPLLGDASVLAAKARSIAYVNDARRLPNALISAVSLVIGVFELSALPARPQTGFISLAGAFPGRPRG